MSATYTYSDELYSDFFKDAYGFRPRGEIYARWNAMTPDQKQREWDMIGDAFDDRQREEDAAYARAKADFDKRVADTIALGAKDEATAIRWILDGAGISLKDISFYGGSYICHEFGLAYSEETRFESLVKEIQATVDPYEGMV